MSLISHLTSAHSRFDVRIHKKMCTSLASHGHDVALIVADGKGNDLTGNIKIYDAGQSKGRFDRIKNAPGRVLAQAVELKADIYHLHDPELIPIGMKLRRLGMRVIFDFHEDVPKQLLGKPYLNKMTLALLSKIFSVFEAWACAKFNGVICATPAIRDKFLRINPVTVDINNFPLLDELNSDVSWDKKFPEICYAGGISKHRGISEVCQAMGLVKSRAQLNLCGEFSSIQLEQSVKAMPGWKKVVNHGFLSRDSVREILSRSMAGLVTFHPLPNHIDAQPNKMFEYMSAGIPVIASDFPLWKEIIEGNQCGLLVNPQDPEAIAKAIDYLVTNPSEAQRMGANGRKAVVAHYNWAVEEKKLLAFYKQIMFAPST